MKKNLIYTVAFLLCGSFLFGSCQDMLNVDSDRVEYDYESWTPSDSVYSVLGILKAVQGVTDRQILLNELRADLITVSKTKALAEIQEIYNSDYSNLETNKYLDVKDYYTIINNCNIFLNRVDTTLSKNGQNYMMREYVAVKSIRAWAYLQLAINHNEIPFFTEPVTKHSVAEEMMLRPKLSRNDVLDRLITDILPYENPLANPMPIWSNNNNADALGVVPSKLFVPIRMLLGEMYLWKGDYENAAKFFYGQITGAASVHAATTVYNGQQYADNANLIRRNSSNSNGKTGISSLTADNSYLKLFSASSGSLLTIVPFATNEKNGTTSELATIFAPPYEVGGAQVFASPGIVSLAALQKYCYAPENEPTPEYGDLYDYPGDLRIKSMTYSETATDHLHTKYSNIIAKFNIKEDFFLDPEEMEAMFIPSSQTSFVMLQRSELAYLRFAEALVGLAEQGYVGAMETAMETLKEGLKKQYQVIKDPVYKDSVRLGKDGKPVTKKVTDDEGNTIEVEVRDRWIDLEESGNVLTFNFALPAFENNIGIHSRGSGESERNEYYALDTLCIARYMGRTDRNDEGLEITTCDIKKEDSLRYMRDLVLDELALEFSWEGFRFGDLVRFAKAMDDPDVLAMRIAGREKNNDVTYRHPEYDKDNELYDKMCDEANWYIPLPDTAVKSDDK